MSCTAGSRQTRWGFDSDGVSCGEWRQRFPERPRLRFCLQLQNCITALNRTRKKLGRANAGISRMAKQDRPAFKDGRAIFVSTRTLQETTAQQA